VSVRINKTLSEFNFCNTVKHEKLSTITHFIAKVEGNEGRKMGSNMKVEGREDRGTGERSKIGKGKRWVSGREEGIGRKVG
jgi:hypothetical protein